MGELAERLSLLTVEGRSADGHPQDAPIKLSTTVRILGGDQRRQADGWGGSRPREG